MLSAADQIEEVDPDVKDELEDLNQRWNILHDASESKSSTYENIMISWQEFREHELNLLNWVDEKGRQISENKSQVNYADADEVIQQIQQLKVFNELRLLKCICSEKFSCKKKLSYLKELLKLFSMYNVSISYLILEILRFV